MKIGSICIGCLNKYYLDEGLDRNFCSEFCKYRKEKPIRELLERVNRFKIRGY